MRRLSLLPLLLWGCITDPTATPDPAPDASVDAEVPDQCAALPVCPSGTREAVDCTHTECITAELCGNTIQCAPCDPSPPCPGDTIPVAECPPDLTCVPPINSCGERVTCVPMECTCADGAPGVVCPPDTSCDPLPECADPVGCPAEPCVADCALPVDACLEADPFCEFVEACGALQACLDPDICGPGGQPYCPDDALYAPDCAPDDPRCVEVTACDSTHMCRLPCPVHTHPVDGCLPTDPACWVVDGQACASDACFEPDPVDLCQGLQPVEVCNDAELCELRSLCGVAQQCQGEGPACADGEIICPQGWRDAPCRPDGRECMINLSCAQLVTCVRCTEEEDCD